MPLSDRDYMRAPQPRRGGRRYVRYSGFSLDPVLALIAINFVFFMLRYEFEISLDEVRFCKYCGGNVMFV